ncbi:MAG: hypothetical protein AB3N21_13755 [Ruegeria sp.]|uniref:hypothetical protein n=1 Tax=Ruegeria sp. TaxID=1879320 RepID=UPI00349F033D
MDASIILQGRQPNFVNAIAQGMQAGATARDIQQRNALRDLYQTQGPQIAAGDPNAINALAQFDPMAAMNTRAKHETMGRQRKAFQMQIEEHARTMSAAQASETAKRIGEGVKQAVALYNQGDLGGVNQMLIASGGEPIQSLDEFPDRVALYENAFEVFERASQLRAPTEPVYRTIDGQLVQTNAEGGPAAVQIEGMTPKPPEPVYREVDGQIVQMNAEGGARAVPIDGLQPPSPDWRAATPEESAKYGAKAGQLNTETGEFKRTPTEKGMVISSDGQGGFTLVQGGGEQVTQFGTKARNMLDERTINAAAMLNRLRDTKALLRPEYLQIPTRLGAAWGQAMDKMGRATPEQQSLVANFAQFKTEAFNNLNTSLKELSGAAVTPQEAERLLEQLPKVGTGVLDGDSPVEFQAKMEQAILQQKRAIARYNLWQAQGAVGNPWDMGSLDQVDKMINARGIQIEEQLRGNGITDPQVLKQQVAQQLRREVGI